MTQIYLLLFPPASIILHLLALYFACKASFTSTPHLMAQTVTLSAVSALIMCAMCIDFLPHVRGNNCWLHG